MWRQTDDRKVWYEWLVEVYAIIESQTGGQTSDADGKGHSTQHRTAGRRCKVGTSELHSSIKEACLM